MEMAVSLICRFLPLLGGLLLIEALAGFIPLINEWANSPFGAIVYFGGISLLACLGISALVLSCRPADWRTPVAILCLGPATAFVPALLPPDGTWVLTSDQFSWLFGETAFVLELAGAPLLWGSALVRRERPHEPGALRIGRIGAALIMLGFVISVISHATNIVRWSSFSFAGLLHSSSALDVLGHLLRITTLLILFWGSVEGVRTVRRPTDGMLIAQRVRRLMKAWFLLRASTSLQNLISWQLDAAETEKPAYLAQQTWQLTVLVTFVLTVVVLVARRFPSIGEGSTS